MNNKKFKTNINCSACVIRVSKALNETVGEDNWHVDTAVPQKILTVNAEGLSTEEIESAVKSAGFKIEEV